MAWTPPDPAFAARVRESFEQQGIMRLIGAKLGSVGPGTAEISLPWRPDLTQQDGFFHAGVVATIADSAAGYAAFTLMPAGSRVLTVEFKLNLMAPARGPRLVASAAVERSGRTLSVVQARVHTMDGPEANEVALMQATMICLRA
jgi:uncharacterized protein (TIGR00369 family)